MKQSPSDRLFAVQVTPQDRVTVLQRLAFLGRVQPLDGSDILLLSFRDAAEAPRDGWRRAQDVLGTAGTVQPVLFGEDGEPHYPTGEISVRFWQSLGDGDLQGFTQRHGLRLLRRNEFVPQQAVFEPVDAPGSYLPEVVERIEAEENVKAAWVNTLSHFQRALRS